MKGVLKVLVTQEGAVCTRAILKTMVHPSRPNARGRPPPRGRKPRNKSVRARALGATIICHLGREINRLRKKSVKKLAVLAQRRIFFAVRHHTENSWLTSRADKSPWITWTSWPLYLHLQLRLVPGLSSLARLKI